MHSEPNISSDALPHHSTQTPVMITNGAQESQKLSIDHIITAIATKAATLDGLTDRDATGNTALSSFVHLLNLHRNLTALNKIDAIFSRYKSYATEESATAPAPSPYTKLFITLAQHTAFENFDKLVDTFYNFRGNRNTFHRVFDRFGYTDPIELGKRLIVSFPGKEEISNYDGVIEEEGESLFISSKQMPNAERVQGASEASGNKMVRLVYHVYPQNMPAIRYFCGPIQAARVITTLDPDRAADLSKYSDLREFYRVKKAELATVLTEALKQIGINELLLTDTNPAKIKSNLASKHGSLEQKRQEDVIDALKQQIINLQLRRDEIAQSLGVSIPQLSTLSSTSFSPLSAAMDVGGIDVEWIGKHLEDTRAKGSQVDEGIVAAYEQLTSPLAQNLPTEYVNYLRRGLLAYQLMHRPIKVHAVLAGARSDFEA